MKRLIVLGYILSMTIGVYAQNYTKAYNGKYYLQIEVEDLLKPEDFKYLKELGLSNVKFLAPRLYSFSLEQDPSNLEKQVSHLGKISDINPIRKKGYGIKLLPESADSLFVFMVRWHDGIDAEEAINKHLVEGIEWTKAHKISKQFSLIKSSPTMIDQIAAWPEVNYIDVATERDSAINDRSRRILSVIDATADQASGGYGIHGEGITVGVGDNANVQSHIDYVDRLINHNGYFPLDHGIHTTGTVGGAGIIRSEAQGTLTKSKLVSDFFSNILDYTENYYQDYGMSITNNSYGAVAGICSFYGLYDATSLAMDELIVDIPEVTHIFAAGNGGWDSCGSGPLGYYRVHGQYQTAKNNITVANVDLVQRIFPTSSRGPLAYDKRLKPDLSAMGAAVLSTKPNDTYGYGWGTSMASPAVVGVAGLLSQKYKEINGATPFSDVLKALLLNGANDMGRKGPDVEYGYGRPSFYRSVKMIERNSLFIDTMTQGDSMMYTIPIAAGTEIAKIMLYYHDLPGTSSPTYHLINNLDLYVIDPNGDRHYPYVVNTDDDSTILLPAITTVDSINNTEQVVIEKPMTGNYQIIIKGTRIVSPQQRYVVAYDTIMPHIHIRSPFRSEKMRYTSNGKGLMFWDKYETDSSTVNIEYSLDLGSTWTSLITGINDTQDFYSWNLIRSDDQGMMVRISTSTGLVATSGPFTVDHKVTMSLEDDSLQCPGFTSVRWSTNSKFTDYYVYRKIGDDLIIIDSTTNNFYTYSNMSLKDHEYMAVGPRQGTMEAFRAWAIKDIANYGDCKGSQYVNDLAVLSTETRKVGRMHTSSEFGNNETIEIQYANHGSDPVGSAILYYRINNGSWSASNLSNIPAHSSQSLSLNGLDFSAPGKYLLEVAIENQSASDPFQFNDTLVYTFRQLSNPSRDLNTAVVESFETATDSSVLTAKMGVEGIDAIDLQSSSEVGRMRTYFMQGAAHTGNHAITLDVWKASDSTNIDSFFYTQNLDPLDAYADNVRFDFYYAHHGQDTVFGTENYLYIRGSESDPWVECYDLIENQELSPGQYKAVRSLELAKILRDQNQNFSTSTQLLFTQEGVLGAGEFTSFNGYTFDDFRFYKVQKDVFIQNVDTPYAASCGLGTNTPLGITVRNTHLDTLQNVIVAYNLNGAGWNTQTIPVLYPDSNLKFIFSNTLDFSAYGPNILDLYVHYGQDSYRENDTLTGIEIYNQPYIDEFPYIQEFEDGDGYFNISGKNPSWIWTDPSGLVIDRAPSGNKIWKSGQRNYNSNENSGLRTPCFDVSSLTTPYLSFNMIYSIENCGTTLCDGAWMEVSYDGGKFWSKLDLDTNQTSSWYTDTVFQLWNGTQNYWKSYSIPVDKSLGDIVQYRWMISADPGVEMEGLAIDDIHVYDLEHKLFYDSSSNELTSNLNISAGSNPTFLESGDIYLALDSTYNMGQTEIKMFTNGGAIRTRNDQYMLDRNFTIKPQNASIADTSFIKLYITQQEIDRAVEDTACSLCSKPRDFLDISVLQFSSIFDTIENNLLYDNTVGSEIYHLADVQKVPYLDGYYFNVPVTNFSEFWFTFKSDSVINTPLMSIYDISGYSSDQQAFLTWKVRNEYNNHHFELYRSEDYDGVNPGTWTLIDEIPTAGNSSNNIYDYIDNTVTKVDDLNYYFVKSMDNAGVMLYSDTVAVIFGVNQPWKIYPNPFQGMVKFNFGLPANTPVKATFLDMSGRVVRENNFIASGATETISLGNDLAAGVYHLEISCEGRREHFLITRL